MSDLRTRPQDGVGCCPASLSSGAGTDGRNLGLAPDPDKLNDGITSSGSGAFHAPSDHKVEARASGNGCLALDPDGCGA